MALKAVSNSLLLHAEFPSDIEALGTNDGITADHIAWIEEAKSWAVPRTISAATTGTAPPLELERRGKGKRGRGTTPIAPSASSPPDS